MFNPIKLLVIFSLVLASTLASADPFSPEWNWENKKTHGPVKEIVTISPKHGNIAEYFAPNGRKTRKIIFDKSNKAQYTTNLTYNKNGDLCKITFSIPYSKEAMYVETAEYKNKGIISSISNLRNGKTSSSKEFAYDKNGLSSIIIAMGSRIMTWKFKFSDVGNLAESALSYNTKIIGRSKYIHDKHGNPVSITTFRNGKKTKTIAVKYKYDNKGNWLKKTETVNYYKNNKTFKKYTLTKERKIIYY
ncbi:MAG: hypothetical protein GY750_08000 [Lentisphaerae bacterium]|nr:hypothetical protein [Lentisphaerota bacterium]